MANFRLAAREIAGDTTERGRLDFDKTGDRFLGVDWKIARER